MKLKSQLFMSIVILGAVFLIIFSSYIITNQQVTQLNNQEQVALSIQTGASDLNYLTNDYFLFQQSEQVILFESKISSLSNDLSKLNSTDPTQAMLISNTKNDLQRLDSVFGDAVMFLENAQRNVSVRVLPAFQTAWSRLAVQSQTLTYDSVQLSQTIRAQSDLLKQTNSLIVFAMVGAFAVYFVTIYFLVFNRTFRSIAKLREGTKIIGSGNLDYSITPKGNDEIGELSRAFNQMTTDLKTVIASKTDLEQAQASLRESEQRWATTLASIGDAVIATDTLGKIVFMNSEAEELTGWALSEASKLPLKTVFHIINEQSRLEVESPIEKVLREGMVVGLANHTVLIRKDGAEVPIDDSGAPIKDNKGKTTGVVLIFRDITERKKAEEELQQQKGAVQQERDRLSSLLNSITDEVWFADPQKKLTLANPSAIKEFQLDSLGINDVENIAASFEVYRPDGTPRPVEEAPPLLALKGEILKNQEEIVKTPNHPEVRYRQVSAAPVRDKEGNIIGSVSVVRDITELKLLQSHLQKYSQDLEKLVEERTKQLKDSERLAAIGATAGMVGHDIRNPLQAITGDVYLAKTELALTPDTDEKKNALESLTEIEKNIDYINKIVQDLQDYSRPLKPSAKGTNLESLCQEVLLKSNVPKNIKTSFKVEKEAKQVMVDPDLLKRVISNLVLNAIQAMPKGGKLSINAYRKEGGLVIEVQDTGEGISDEVKTKLFTPMFTTKSKGQGFGLSVVKRVTESMNGTVAFESEQGKGTKFTIRLPPPKELNGKFTYKLA
jgi:PAS domain S-box-containing protein